MSRIRLHKHLFTSLLLHAIISALLKWHLLKSTHNRSASDDRSEFSRVHGYAGAPLTDSASETGGGGGGIPSLIDPSSFKWPSLCLVLSVLLRYFRSVNYLWMFNEALYLHQLIKHAFSQPSLRPLIILAYSLPFITTTSYIFARSMAPFTLEPTAFVEEAYAEGGAAGQLHTAATAAAGNDQHSQSSLYSAQQLVDRIYAAQQVGLADQADGLAELSTTGGNSQPAVFLLSLDDQQMNDRVHYALSSLIRSSPAIRHQLMTQQDSSSSSSSSSSPEPDSWLNDLLASGGDGSNHRQQFLATAERLVAEESTTTEPTLEEQQNANGVLANFDAFEDVSLLEEEDNCWLMPSYESWHEWIINVPNLAILIVSRALTFSFFPAHYFDSH